MPTYLKYEYIFSSLRFKVGSGVESGSGFFPAEPDPDPLKKMSDPHPWQRHTNIELEIGDEKTTIKAKSAKVKERCDKNVRNPFLNCLKAQFLSNIQSSLQQ